MSKEYPRGQLRCPSCGSPIWIAWSDQYIMDGPTIEWAKDARFAIPAAEDPLYVTKCYACGEELAIKYKTVSVDTVIGYIEKPREEL